MNELALTHYSECMSETYISVKKTDAVVLSGERRLAMAVLLDAVHDIKEPTKLYPARPAFRFLTNPIALQLWAHLLDMDEDELAHLFKRHLSEHL